LKHLSGQIKIIDFKSNSYYKDFHVNSMPVN